MPTSIEEIFSRVSLRPEGPVGFGEPIFSKEQGVYVLTGSPDGTCSSRKFEFSTPKLEEWLNRCPDMRLDGVRPTSTDLERELASWWLADEPILYIGMTTRSLRQRLRQYFRTPIGATKPHAGGFWVHTLATNLYVFSSNSNDPLEVEARMLEVLGDAHGRLPWANLSGPRGRKPHRLSGQTC